MTVKCLSQEHNPVPQLDLRPLDPESSALSCKPPCFPVLLDINLIFTSDFLKTWIRILGTTQPYPRGL